jgi:hypothetical protein
MEPRKRSQIVVLTLIGVPFGAIALADAFPGQQVRRNLYPDQAACVRDYSPQQCQANSSSSGGGSGGGHGGGGGYHGPYYASNRTTAGVASDPGPGRTGQITRTETSVRGGFGAFGRAMRAVG